MDVQYIAIIYYTHSLSHTQTARGASRRRTALGAREASRRPRPPGGDASSHAGAPAKVRSDRPTRRGDNDDDGVLLLPLLLLYIYTAQAHPAIDAPLPAQTLSFTHVCVCVCVDVFPLLSCIYSVWAMCGGCYW